MAVVVQIAYAEGHGYVPAVQLEAVAGGTVQLDVGAGAAVVKIKGVDDPQGTLRSYDYYDYYGAGASSGRDASEKGANRAPSGPGAAIINATVAANATQFSVVSVEVVVGGGNITQYRLFKLNVTDPASEAARTAKVSVSTSEAAGSTWETVDLAATTPSVLNGNLSNIFHPEGGYLEPRPATCSSRIGVDGYSAWTFTYGQGDSPPFPNFKLVPENGSVVTAQGARFNLRHCSEAANVAFVSRWTNYPTSVTVPVTAAAGDIVWLLVAGSTNAMQTRLANAVIRYHYADGSSAALDEELELLPPINYWSLTPIGGIDYDYGRDAFCLPPEPPPTVQLGDHNRAMVYAWRVAGDLTSVSIEALSLEVVVGLLAVSVSHAGGG